MTTVLIYAGSDLESDLRRTLFWREDLERYVAERVDEARMLALSAEPHVVVVDLDLPGADQLVDSPLHAGDDVSLSLLLPAMDDPVEGRARVVRQPVEERLGLRFEAFSGNGDARIREFLAALASPSRP